MTHSDTKGDGNSPPPPLPVLVTGGTNGVGLRTARRLVRSGRPVVVTGTRERTVAEASRATGATGVVLDLASPTSVDDAADEILARTGGRIGAVLLNAGTQVSAPTTTADGVELTIAVNHVGHVQLWESLRARARVDRLVLTTSGTHDPAQRTGMPEPLPAVLEDLVRPPGPGVAASLRRYPTSKLANVLTAYEIARREPATTVVAYDPGLMPGTGLVRHQPTWFRVVWRGLGPLLTLHPRVTTPGASARHLAALADGSLRVPSGSYVSRGRPARSSDASHDEDVARRLYDDTLALVARRLAASR
ncbi:SDR family NAD(P)-dependent oxidoreductase [Cellulosimicrobium protaetiae]|uniref:SDR family NAD(P)-dependent oxidoreductase n=1 Tax=Cellulosimicrobium protaetiae TaxID=2587808 RepID=A0A6M5UKQ5_9MICO|nr:SDR family NAD(P)-dependent oxidoreductase [Cellulosimicrobium protaetiae]QJW37678.1 SDR family NAD(P)-dependent oxidoreductase [Cellulosimicrobium protaetiae]